MSNFQALFISGLAGAYTVVGGILAVQYHDSLDRLPFAGILAAAAAMMITISFLDVLPEALEIMDRPDKATVSTLLILGWMIATSINAIFRIPQIDESRSLGKPSRPVKVTLLNNPLLKILVGSHELSDQEERLVEFKFRQSTRAFKRIGFSTAVVLVLHNLPEGIATYAAATANLRPGINLAVAIGLHNIPEGFAIAVPVYCGTRNKKLALLLTAVAALAELVGGIVACSCRLDKSNKKALAVVLILTCGIMFNIAIKDLLFTAIRYDPANQITTLAFFTGFVFISASTGLLEIIR